MKFTLELPLNLTFAFTDLMKLDKNNYPDNIFKLSIMSGRILSQGVGFPVASDLTSRKRLQYRLCFPSRGAPPMNLAV